MTVLTGLSLPSRYLRFRRSLMAATAMLAVLAIVCSALAIRYQKSMIDASRYNETFDLEQTAVEVLRLQLSLRDVEQGGTADRTAFRYAILINRTKVISAHETSGDPTLVRDLSEVVRRLGPLIDRLPDPDAARLARERLDRFVAPMLQVASMSHARAGDDVSRNQRDLGGVFVVLCALTMALVMCGAGLVAFVVRQNQKLGVVARADALTGIPNRLSFNTELAATRHQTQSVILVDIDHFKALNDTLGHEAGDRVLREMAARVRRAAVDAATIARMGGDELAVLYIGDDAPRRSQAFCERLLSSVSRPFVIDGQLVRSTVTLGIGSASPDQPDRNGRLLRSADIALYTAKAAGRNRFETFQPEMEREFVRRQRLRDDLVDAAARGELHLVFQPLVALPDGRTQGFEALLRWKHPELGAVSPVEFIPIAEEGGQIARIGRWVVEEACRHAADWPDPIYVSINVSAKQLVDTSLVPHIQDCLKRHGLAPERLLVEITESALIGNDASALEALRNLRKHGCGIALDDFGTGYASLSYLRRFPFSKLKIDRSFVEAAAQDEDGVTILTAICELARRLRLRIVAEGVETEAQRRIVESVGCDFGQGYLFDRPLSWEAALVRVERESRPATAIAPESRGILEFA